VALFLLVRHAAHDLLDRLLAGRMDGVPLSAAGRQQAAELASRLSRLKLTAVHSSPRLRARETAAPIAALAGLPVEVCPALDEVDFGEWTGRSFGDLASDPAWRRWNEERGASRPPGGESMAEAQQRLLAHIAAAHARSPDGRTVMVTHAEIVRAAVLHARSLPISAWNRISIAPASVTVIRSRPGVRRASIQIKARAAA
jgi:broad specificity phosphatase PhoE